MAQTRIQDSVGTALRGVRQTWQTVLLIAAIGAIATTLVQAAAMLSPLLVYPLLLVTTLINGFVYAALTVVALRAWRPTLTFAEGVRAWAAMAIIGFFLLIVFVVTIIPGAMFLLLGPLAKYRPALESAGQSEAAVYAVMQRIWIADPWPVVIFALFYVAIFFYLSTRLYLAAPATVDRGRILTFETWSWTKGAVLRIAGARLMLILPAYILANAINYLITRAAGVDMFKAAAEVNGLVLLVVIAVGAFISSALYGALGAALSTALYRDLGGPQAQLPPR